MQGLVLTFHLAGINNQNFLMRDEQTGTFWQQISGKAISGPLAGRQLTRIPSDELTFALWRGEQPAGTVLQDDSSFSAQYAPEDWDVKMQKTPVVIRHAEGSRKPRDLVLGIRVRGVAKAYLYQTVLKQLLVQDRVGSTAVLLAVGPDNLSIRGFEAGNTDFYRTPEGILIDAVTGSKWNFQGCAEEGKRKGVCLPRVEVTKDYWFDWREYNPGTAVY